MSNRKQTAAGFLGGRAQGLKGELFHRQNRPFFQSLGRRGPAARIIPGDESNHLGAWIAVGNACARSGKVAGRASKG